MPGAAGQLLDGVAGLGKGIMVVGFKGAAAMRSVWMDTVHAWAHRWRVAWRVRCAGARGRACAVRRRR
jgi:hypothetical protein